MKLPIDRNFYDNLVSGVEDRSTVVIYLDAVDAGHPKPEDLAIRWETLRDMWRAYTLYNVSYQVVKYLEEETGTADWYQGGCRAGLVQLRIALINELYEVRDDATH